jgi:hypothetical protein
MSNLIPPTDNDRLHIFESVQFDPELWSLVQQKYNHFEELHREIADLQKQRGDLLTQLSKVNESIAKLQQQLVTLSGQEAEDAGREQAEAAAQEEASESPNFDKPQANNWSVAPMHDFNGSKLPELEDDESQETVVGLKPLEFEGVDNGSEEPEDEEADQKIDVAPYEPAVEPETAAEPAIPAAQPRPGDGQPLAGTEPVGSPVEAAPAVAQPIQDEKPAQDSGPVPAEVDELQKLFDQADEQRRQSDSALKLVQLYDGRAETFFAAMCRSHQQSGLSDEDARKEAVKDVQTMIATAKHNVPAGPKKPEDQPKANGKNGGMRRLFSHS